MKGSKNQILTEKSYSFFLIRTTLFHSPLTAEPYKTAKYMQLVFKECLISPFASHLR